MVCWLDNFEYPLIFFLFCHYRCAGFKRTGWTPHWIRNQNANTFCFCVQLDPSWTKFQSFMNNLTASVGATPRITCSLTLHYPPSLRFVVFSSFFFIIYMSVSFDFTLAIFFLTSCWWLLFYFFSWFFLSEYHSLSQTFILICLFCAGIRLCTSLRIGQSHKFYQQRFTSQTRSNPIEFTIVRRLYRNILGRTII